MKTKLSVAMLIMVLAAILVGCGGSDNTVNNDEAAETPILEGLTRDNPLLVGNVEVPSVDAEGNETPFSFFPEEGRLLFVYFGYTQCPDLCPTTFSDFKGALLRLDPAQAAQIDTAFVTVDPERDTPEIMNAYLGHFVERGSAIRLLDPDQLQETESAFGASSTIIKHPDGVIEVSHTAVAYIVAPNGEVVVEWPFGVKSDAMASDLEVLLKQIS